MKIIAGVFVSFLMICIFSVATAEAATPRTIAYQGFLKDAKGAPLNAMTTMRLNLYTSNTGGTALWTESRGVQVVNGIYTINLGDTTALNLAFDQPYWLGISVNGEPELQPLQALNSVPYSFRSTIADSVPDKTISAAKIGQVCSDGDILRYDSLTATWRCNPANGGFPLSPPMVGALTISTITPVDIASPKGPDPSRDILVYGFDFQISISSVGKAFPGSLKVITAPKAFAPLIALSAAKGTHLLNAGLWFRGNDKTFEKFITLSDVIITGEKSIPPTRPGESTKVEYTLSYTRITFTSPSNPSQTADFNFTSNVMSGCNHPDPVFTINHGMGINLDTTLVTTSYPAASYSTSLISSGLKASFSTIMVTLPLGLDGPCFMTDANGRFFRFLTVYTAAPQSTQTNILLESRIRTAENGLSSYRLYTDTTGAVMQDMTYNYSQIYWGYYPINPQTGVNDPIVESGWDILANRSAL